MSSSLEQPSDFNFFTTYILMYPFLQMFSVFEIVYSNVSESRSSLAMSDKKSVIKNADMSEEMQQVFEDHWRFNHGLCSSGCCGLRHRSPGEIQHWEGHRCSHQEGLYYSSFEPVIRCSPRRWTRSTSPPGTASWAGTLGPTSLTRQGDHSEPWHPHVSNILFRHFIYFYLGQVAVLLFKSGWILELATLDCL